MVITHTQNKRQNNNNYANERGKWEPVDVEEERKLPSEIPRIGSNY